MPDVYLSINSRNAGKKYEVSNILNGEITWTTERVGVASKLTFTVIKEGEIIFHEGDQVRLEVDGVPLFLGYVFSKDKNREKIAVTCYDMLRYLKAKQSYLIKDMKLGDVISLIAKDFQLTTGELADTGYVLPKKRYEAQTLFDIITNCLHLTLIKTDIVYNVYDNVGALTLKKAEDMKVPLVITTVPTESADQGERILTDYHYKTSIDDDTYNVVKLVWPNKQTGKGDVYSSKDDDGINLWGKLQYYEKLSGEFNEAEIRDKVSYLLNYFSQVRRTLKLEALGNTSVRAGCMIKLYIPDLGDIALHKTLLVNSCTHKISSNSHTMSLEMIVENG